MKRKATAVWSGTGMDGSGHLSTQSGVLNETQYSFKSRFADGSGTNPEELLAAAHAGCFTMKLTFWLQEKGFIAEKLETNAVISLEEFTITESHLTVKAKVPGLSEEIFAEAVNDAEKNCPVSKALNLKISVESTLES
ncbi:OsmC family protein [Flavobacterium aquatile]|uniref:Peroxiredoxin n=1 Tax=Flavobacterium aquatile LMG 4008 = ATCC 11947 TaxID=1453498 RepID=A0A095SYS8_9FLAO|nr:OsmC family protein [Flavobacterium aquatile]KGD69702.1 peroxiredoxin [Flavobacterium aquatile LMG 4008 = ATCC 11947]OXA67164.1 OsmC family peroxiredoxin [Flavobacterium aquatile LMG 4008 = ATCC 11947]GEC77817.1 peroxiredoxin [Flavobacterium aquatile]